MVYENDNLFNQKRIQIIFDQYNFDFGFLLAPLIYAFIIGFTYKEGKVTDIPVLVVNQDNSPLSLQLEEMLADNQSIKVIHHSNEPVDLKNEIIRQDAAAVVIIPERFEAMVLQKKYPEVNVHINTEIGR